MMRHDDDDMIRHDDDIMMILWNCLFWNSGGPQQLHSNWPRELPKATFTASVQRASGQASIDMITHELDGTNLSCIVHCLSMSFIINLRNSIRFHTFALIVAILVNILSHLHLSLLFEAFSIRHRINGASKVPKPVYTLRSLLQKTWSLRWSHNPTMRSLISGKNMQWSYTCQFELQTMFLFKGCNQRVWKSSH